jgi:hypothetical protein
MPRASARHSVSVPHRWPSRTICRCRSRRPIAIGWLRAGALITTRRPTRRGKLAASASATIPPYEAPTAACRESIPTCSQAATIAVAWSTVETGGKDPPCTGPVVLPRPPSQSKPRISNCSVSRARPGPTCCSHHPSGSAPLATSRPAEIPPNTTTAGRPGVPSRRSPTVQRSSRSPQARARPCSSLTSRALPEKGLMRSPADRNQAPRVRRRCRWIG